MYDCDYNKPILYITGRYNDVCGIQISKGEWAHYRRSSLGHTFPDAPQKRDQFLKCRTCIRDKSIPPRVDPIPKGARFCRGVNTKSHRLPPLHKETKMAYPCAHTSVNIHVFQYFKKSYSTIVRKFYG